VSFRGTNDEPRRLGADLDRVVAGLGATVRANRPGTSSRADDGEVRGAAGLFGRWEQLVGPDIAAHTRLVGVRDRTLVVATDDPAWAAELRWLTSDLMARIVADGGPALEGIQVRVRPR
jgi:predicted nucleic acid-binding Zn ribbon protein